MKTRLNKKRVAIVAIIAVVIVVGVLAYQALGEKDEAEYRTAKVERGMIISSISASGRITGTSSASVTTQATGVIKEIYVRDGDYVEAGDKLFVIELDRDGKLNKAKAWASYLGAKNELESAKQNKIASSRDIASADIDLASAEQSKQSLQREITLAQVSVESAQDVYDTVKAVSANDSELKQKQLSLQAAQDALALAKHKFDNAVSSSSVSAEQNKLALKKELDLAKASLSSAQEAYDIALDDTSTSSAVREQKELALQAAQNALTLAQSKYDNVDTNNNTSSEQSKLSLQREVALAESSLIAAQDAYDKAKKSAASQSELKQKELALQAAQDALTLAQDKYSSSDMSIERADLGVSLAKQKAGNEGSAVERAEANLEAAKLAYEATLPTVRAPVSGTIRDIALLAGMTISGDASSADGASASGNGSAGVSTGSKKLATIAAGGHTTAEFSITEMDVVKVKAGLKATITLDALSGKTFTAKVIGIDKTGSVNSGVTTYPVTVQINTKSDEILPNMAANANIITETKDDVLLIPAGASQTVGSQATVIILRNNTPQQIPVQLGLVSEVHMEVVSGLTEGDEVVVATLSGQQSSGTSPFGGTGIRSGGMGALGGAGMRPGGFSGGGSR